MVAAWPESSLRLPCCYPFLTPLPVCPPDANACPSSGEGPLLKTSSAKAYSDGGDLLATAVRQLESQRQLAQLIQEIFPALHQPAGWLLMESDQPNMEGFFLIFDFSLTAMDGTAIGGTALRELVLPGADDAEISLVNPSAAAAAGTLEYLDDAGSVVASRAIDIGPLGRITLETDQLRPSVVRGGYVRYRGDALASVALLGNTNWLGLASPLDASEAQER